MNVLSYLHKSFFVFLLIALAIFQTSCGFHLRGAVGLSDYISPVFLDLNGSDDDLRRELKKLMTASGENNLASSQAEAKSILSISNVQKKQRVVSVDNRGRAREYELNYQFRYELKPVVDLGGQGIIIKTNTIKLKRDLLFDPNSVLAVGHEKNAMYDDMRKDAAQLVLRQLSVIKSPGLPH